MEDFHYNCIKNKYGDKAKMLLTDTGSLMYKIETKSSYEDLYKDKELFDFSNYPNDSKYYSGTSNFVTGKMKGKTGGMPIKGFLELKTKMYTVITIMNLKR